MMKRNKRGEMNGVGIIIIVAITLIVGIILFQAISQEVGKATNTIEISNESLGAAVADATAQYLSYRSLSDVVVYNATNDVIVTSGNYTVTNNEINPTTGELAVKILPGTVTAGYKSAWLISGTAQPTTYVAEAGGRAMAGLIGIFFALALVVVAMTPILREKLLAGFR